MARPGVSYMEVEEAVNALLGQSKTPTLEHIRGYLGTGSITTIANHFKKWKALQASFSVDALKEKPPQELLIMVRGLWERLIGQSESKITDVEQNYYQALSLLQQQLDKYQANNRRWQKLYHSWREQYVNQQQLYAEQQAKLAQTEQAIVSLNSQLDLAQEQLKQKQIRIDELHRLHLQAQANLEHFRATTREQRLVDEERYQNTLQLLETTTAQLVETQAQNSKLTTGLAKRQPKRKIVRLKTRSRSK